MTVLQYDYHNPPQPELTLDEVYELCYAAEPNLRKDIENLKYYAVVISAVFVGPWVSTISDFTNYDWEFVKTVKDRMYKNRLWSFDTIHNDWVDEKEDLRIAIGIALDVLVAKGELVAFVVDPNKN